MDTEMRRRFFTPLVRGLLVCLLGSSGFAAAAEITEVESNDSLSSAQRTPVPPEGLTISGRMGDVAGDLSADVDFFAFEATGGDILSIELKDTLKPDGAGTCLGFPSNLALYDSVGVPPLSPLVAAIGVCDTLTEASFTTQVSGLTRRTIIVGVSAWNRIFEDDGVVGSADMETPGGTYQLVISGVTPPDAPPPDEEPPAEQPAVKNVPIVVRHWHQDERDLERRRGRDPIVVAILSARRFRPTQEVDPNSLTFGRTGSEKSLFRCRKNGKDINRDGRNDMVCYFKPDVANFQTGDLNGKLEGKTMSGQRIKGEGALRIFSVPRERHGFKHHGERHRDDRKNHKNHKDHDGDDRKNHNGNRNR